MTCNQMHLDWTIVSPFTRIHDLAHSACARWFCLVSSSSKLYSMHTRLLGRNYQALRPLSWNALYWMACTVVLSSNSIYKLMCMEYRFFPSPHGKYSIYLNTLNNEILQVVKNEKWTWKNIRLKIVKSRLDEI